MSKKEEIPEIMLVGLSHKTAPVELREMFSFDDKSIGQLLEKTGNKNLKEIVVLSTCNRMEIYFVSRDFQRAVDRVIEIMEKHSGIGREIIHQHIYKKYSREAVSHLLNVASSLDSLVIGENEILGQVKKAYRLSVDNKRTGILLNKLFHQAFNTAKKVRTETEIAQNPLSIAYIATELAKKIFEDLSKRTALLVGAGEMGELILKYFTKDNISEITIANRSIHNAERIANEINRDAHIVPLEDIARVASDVDIIISSSHSEDFLITYEMIKGIIKKRKNQPLFMIDIAVPRNIDPDTAELNNVFLYNIDDLKFIADENLKNRLKEVEMAREMIKGDTDEFYSWYEGLEIVPTIVKLQDKFEEIRNREIKKYRRRKLKGLSEKEFAVVEELTRQIMTKTLHNPISALKSYSQKKQKGREKMESFSERRKIIEELFGNEE